MTSDRQLRANRRNAQKSTGPRTAEGKAVSRLNALKWGLCANDFPLLPGEDPEEFEALRHELYEHYDPKPGIEERLVEHLASLLQRLSRASRVETGIFAWHLKRVYDADRRTAKLMAVMAETLNSNPTSMPVANDEPEEESVDEELESLVDIFEVRGDAVMDIGRAFVTDGQKANALSKLSRYETTLLRGIERTLCQLHEIQTARSTGSD